MHLFKLWLLSLGHMFTDIAQGALPLFLPYLKETFDLSYFAVGLIFLFSSVASSIIQPVFGLISDRYYCFWMLPVGCFVALTAVAMVGVAPNYWLLLLIVTISGLGVASYHPEASRAVFFLSGEKKATAMSIFSVGGNLGFALGPIIATFLLSLHGLKGSLGFLALGIVTGTILLLALPSISREVVKNTEINGLGRGKEKKTVRFTITMPVILLMVIVTIRSWIHMGLIMYIPLYYLDYLKLDPIYGSSLLTVLLMAGAFGTLIGGPLADRFGLKSVMYFSFASVLPLIYLLFNSTGIATFFYTAFIGAAIVSTFSITTVYAQKLMPENIGLASGLVLGFAIGTGGLGTTILGFISDHWGLMASIWLLMFLPLVGILLISYLPKPVKQPTAHLNERGHS